MSVAVSGAALPRLRTFRLYWLCLNAAYVMEFFLQTLVKRKHLQQRRMLAMNAALMALSSLAAARVVMAHVRPVPALVSLAANFGRRGHELSNTAVLLVACWAGAAAGWPGF